MAAHFKHRTHAARGRIYPHERHAGISRDVPVCHSARRDTGGHNPVLEQNVAVSEQKEKRQRYKKETFVLWFKVVIACIPGFVAYLLLDFVDNCYVVAAALIVYGVLFIVIETGTAAASRESKRSRRYRIRMRSSSACFRLCRSFRAPRAAVLQS